MNAASGGMNARSFRKPLAGTPATLFGGDSHMKLRTLCVTALGLSLAVIATGNRAAAQPPVSSQQMMPYPRVAAAPAPAQQMPSRLKNAPAPAPATAPKPASAAPTAPAAPAASAPTGGYGMEGSAPYVVEGEGYSAGYGECCEQESCAPSSCSEPCEAGGFGLGDLCGAGKNQFFVTAEYLNVHASFSEATAYVSQDLNNGTDQFIPLDFDYNSSYRIGGGWRSSCCGDEIRVVATRMTSDASATALPGDIVPYETAAPPDGQTRISANVDARTIDVECAKTIPLGGQGCGCSDCCDPCGSGCGNSCGSCCPAWDITWSGGVRWADVGWQRSYIALNSDNSTVTDSEIGMDFRGGGIRTGLEGRRYFFKDGWLSLYGKGNVSLLLGDVNVSSIRSVFEDGNAVNTQTFRTRQIIPVTELEGGVTAQVSRGAAITAGYLFAAWHDLGFRDEHDLNTLLPTTYDDANILGFDGFFARVEVGF